MNPISTSILNKIADVIIEKLVNEDTQEMISKLQDDPTKKALGEAPTQYITSQPQQMCCIPNEPYAMVSSVLDGSTCLSPIRLSQPCRRICKPFSLIRKPIQRSGKRQGSGTRGTNGSKSAASAPPRSLTCCGSHSGWESGEPLKCVGGRRISGDAGDGLLLASLA